jgi:hypothetical protein
VKYPQLSFSHETGGTQFYALFNGPEPYQSMVLSYEVAFSEGFEWVKGGKLPGIRGGPNSSGCSGGTQPTGNNCFSIRLMWRPVGTGEGNRNHAQKASSTLILLQFTPIYQRQMDYAETVVLSATLISERAFSVAHLVSSLECECGRFLLAI